MNLLHHIRSTCFLLERLLFFAVVIWMLSSNSRLFAATPCSIYVSPTGSSSNDGSSQGNPTTLQSANTKIVPGSTVCLMDGTYPLTGPLYIGRSGTKTSWITFRAINPHRAIIVWNTTKNDDMFQLTKPSTSYVEISDLVFDGSLNGINTATNAIHPHVGSHHIRILNNRMKNTKASGVATSGSDYLTVMGNIIFHTGNYTSDGADGYGSGVSFNANVWSDQYDGFHSYVIGNMISGTVDGSSHNTDGNGIIMDGSGPQLTADTPPVLIANNLVYQNGGRCVHMLNVSRIWAVNNTCYSNSLDNRVNNGSVGEFSFQRSKDIFVVNNIAYTSPKGYSFAHVSTIGTIYYSHNIGFGGMGTLNVPTGSIQDTKQIQFANPLFINPPPLTSQTAQYASAMNPREVTNQYQLQTRSPGINTGINPSTMTTNVNLKTDMQPFISKDILGSPRPLGNSYDIGAYEQQLGPHKTGDANNDSFVNGADYIIWLNHYGQTSSNLSSIGDFDENSRVDGKDYIIWLKNYGL